jgi:hypothetical protein
MGREIMHYLGEDQVTQIMGGYLGEVRQGSDGNLYEWVEGVDGLGNPIGFWRRFKQLARKALPYVVSSGVALKALQTAAPTLRRVLPIAQRAVSQIPGGEAALKAANPLLRQAGVAGYEGLGALYQAPDGSLYQMQGLAEAEELQGLGEDEATQMMGLGSYVGEVRQGPDGNLYQWVTGIDGLGNPIGFWQKWRKKLRRLVQKAMPLAQKLAPFVPGGSAALTAATPILKQAGVAGYEGLNEGLGALYQAPDGTLYQMQGLAENEALYGYGEADLQGFSEAEELQGYGEDESLYGYGENEELQGFSEAEELQGMEGYVQQNSMRQDSLNGTENLGRYEPQQPPATRWFTAPGQTPEIWKAPW